jgi:hypothetical protein
LRYFSILEGAGLFNILLHFEEQKVKKKYGVDVQIEFVWLKIWSVVGFL